MAPETARVVHQMIVQAVSVELSQLLHDAMFYKTPNGAAVGDRFMSLIHSAELAGANAWHYLNELGRHTELVEQEPGQWLPWNYRETLARIEAGTGATTDAAANDTG